jgi:hypothetical protein
VRYRVRDSKGQELTVPSLDDLVALYRQGFLGDDDEVRRETATGWERAGDLGALSGHRERRREPRALLAILAASVVLAAALALLVAGRRGLTPPSPSEPSGQRP